MKAEPTLDNTWVLYGYGYSRQIVVEAETLYKAECEFMAVVREQFEREES